jgi:hypothetical protein
MSSTSIRVSDSRDKVYGLLGIIDPNNSILPLPDYNQPTTHVFSLVSRRLIEASKTLEVLYLTSEFGSSSCTSWAVD